MYSGIKKLAELITAYSVEVGEGDRVLIDGDPTATSLIHIYLHEEVLKRGGIPFHKLTLGECDYLNMVHASELQYQAFVEDDQRILQNTDILIGIQGSVNPRRLDRICDKVDVVKIIRMNQVARVVRETTYKRYIAGDLKVCYVEYPTDGMAQEMGLPLMEYEEKFGKACFLDKANPIDEWKKLAHRQKRIAEFLETKNRITVKGKGIDLSFSINGEWISDNGTRYLPDGEIYTDHIVKDSVNGRGAFSYPGFFQRKEIPDIELQFEEGKIVAATSSGEMELLKKILFDERKEGNEEPVFMSAFGIGTNYRMGSFVGHASLDEKIGGTIHIALRPPLWVLITQMEEDDVILADDEVIYEGRHFTI